MKKNIKSISASLLAAVTFATGATGALNNSSLLVNATDTYSVMLTEDSSKQDQFDYEILEDGTIEITKGYIDTTVAEHTIPAEIDGREVTSIGDSAFGVLENNTVELIVNLPDTITHIGNDAFHNSGIIAQINMPINLVSVGDYAFANCGPIEEIKFYDHVESIGDGAFRDDGLLLNVKLPDNYATIGEFAFYGAGVTSITIPEKIGGNLGKGIFWRSALTHIDLPEGITHIGEWFSGQGNGSHGAALETIELPSTVTSIAPYAFYRMTDLKSIVIPEGVTTIEPYTFYDCTHLASVTIPETVTEIKELAFGNCKKLMDITLSNSLTKIADKALGYDRIGTKRENRMPDFRIKCCEGSEAYDYYLRHDTMIFKPIPVAPADVANLNVAANENDATLTWDTADNAEGYIVYKHNGETWSRVGVTADTSFTVDKLDPATAYEFGVRSYYTLDDVKMTSLGTATVDFTTSGDIPEDSSSEVESSDIDISSEDDSSSEVDVSSEDDASSTIDASSEDESSNTEESSVADNSSIIDESSTPGESSDAEPQLKGVIYSQCNSKEDAIRFVFEVSEEDITKANQGLYTINIEDVSRTQNISKAYRSLYANGQRIYPEEGNVFIVTWRLYGVSSVNDIEVEFSLDIYDNVVSNKFFL